MNNNQTINETYLRVHNARTNNLKNVSLDIPRDCLVVMTGRSGSGKSSLAIDTIFAEGQSQYIESLSIYARQFFEQSSHKDVELVEGLLPTICLDQTPGIAGPRSTVATISEIYDFLRVLLARAGDITCHGCGRPIQQQTLEQICQTLLDFPPDSKLMILAPMVMGRKGKHADVIQHIRRERLVRVRVDGEVYDIDQLPELSTKKTTTIEAITDRIIIRDGIDNRLFESIELATKMSGGLAIACCQERNPDTGEVVWHDHLFSTQYACSYCDINYAEVQPRSFSFNSPYGACTRCDGLGYVEQFDPESIVPDRYQAIDEGAIVAWKGLSKKGLTARLSEITPILDSLGISRSTNLSTLDDETWHDFLNRRSKSEPGLLVVLAKELSTTKSEKRQDELQKFRDELPCPECDGSRLNQQARAVLLNGKSVGEISSLSISQAIPFFESIEFSDFRKSIAAPLLDDILKRLRFLLKVGVPYLTLGRAADGLSGGEMQRVRLATAIGSGLTNVCYVLDEPTIGLHQRDNDRLIKAIRSLQENGNSIIVVEHDETMIREADWIVDVGPKAGQGGGEIVASGPPEQFVKSEQSLTADYLTGRREIPIPKMRRPVSEENCIRLEGASGNNLQNVDVMVPLGVFNCITGVSGSGKSTLVNQTLVPAISRHLGLMAERPAPFGRISGIERIDKIVHIDQKPIGRTSRGCAATYTGVFDEIRKVFSATKIARQRGYTASRFSFNSKSGWCPTCQGYGVRKITMNFLPDMLVECETCGGQRFNLQTLQVRFADLTISDVLKMPASEAYDAFQNFSKISAVLKSLVDVGLGYLPLGQSSTTLSGGEAKRIKLATELSRRNTGKTLYLIDEPTTGLHFEDIKMLLGVLEQLVELGNTVIVIEHNLDVVKCADWITDLGPEGGENGGQVMATGTPEHVASVSGSYTGQYLKDLLK